MSKDDPCKIKIRVRKGATAAQIRKAVDKALQSKLTDLKKCDDRIAINIKFPR